MLINVAEPLCRYWWNGIFQSSYAWRWILCWIHKCWSIGRSLQLGPHLPSTPAMSAASETMATVVKRGKQSRIWGGDAVTSQLMAAEKLPLLLEIATNTRTKLRYIHQCIIIQEMCQSAFHNYNKISKIYLQLLRKKGLFGSWFQKLWPIVIQSYWSECTEYHGSTQGRSELFISW